MSKLTGGLGNLLGRELAPGEQASVLNDISHTSRQHPQLHVDAFLVQKGLDGAVRRIGPVDHLSPGTLKPLNK